MKEVQEILTALNASYGLPGFKYPYGNEQLTRKTLELERKKKIKFNKYFNRWEIYQ